MLFKRCFNRAEMKFILLFYNNKLNKCGRSMLFIVPLSYIRI